MRALQVLLLAVVAAYALSMLPALRARPGPSMRWDAGVYSAVFYLAALLVLLRGLLVVRQRAVWLVLGTGMTMYASGTLFYALVVAKWDPVPYPSFADALWLSFYPCAYYAVFRLLRSQTPRIGAGAWLDGLVGGIGAAALAAAFVFGLIIPSTGGSAAAVATQAAFVLADLLMLSVVVVALTLLGRRAARAWLLLGAALVGFAAADMTLVVEFANGTYRQGGPLDVSWAVAVLGLAYAAWAPYPPGLPTAAAPRLVVPAVFTATSLGLLLYAAARPLSEVPITLAASCLLLSAVRIRVAFLEMRSLLDVRRIAGTDELTGLPNRRHMLQQLNARSRQRAGEGFAVLLLDVDRFTEINESLGHSAGDQLLQQLGPRLASVLREDDVLARMGGDEFAVLLDGSDEAEAVGIAERVEQELRRPTTLGDVTAHVDLSIGIAIADEPDVDVPSLLQHAGIAMERAKATRSSYAVFARELDGSASDRIQVIADLRRAMAADELRMHYQPKLDLRLQRVTSVEALVRWQHPTRGLLYPDAFLPAAEQAGLMRQLTTTVLGLALRQTRRLHAAGWPLTVAVNISPANLLDVELPRQVADLLAEHGVPATSLVLEITEESMVSDDLRAREVLHRLKSLGLKLSVDDYGRGYSSLSYLQDLPVDELKIDKSFMTKVTDDPRVAAIVCSTIGLAHALRLDVVAEGVEDGVTLDLLRSYGCDVAQGFYVGRPVAGERLLGALVAEPGGRSRPTPVSPPTPPAPREEVGVPATPGRH